MFNPPFPKYLIYILIMCVVIAESAFCQSTLMLPFNKKITTENGLSSYNIKKIVQDKYGFIWIGTQDGLNRYDGKKFVVYNKSAAHKNQISGNDIWDVKEDSARNLLWVITAYGGLDAIDLRTGIVSAKLNARFLKQRVSNTWLKCMQLSGNYMWVGTNDGLMVYNIEGEKFESFQPMVFEKGGGPSIDKIFVDRFSNVWLFIANHGVVIYSGATRKIIHFYKLSEISLELLQPYNQFHTIASLKGGDLLVGTNQGFRKISYNNKGITKVETNVLQHTSQFANANIIASTTDRNGDIWFTTSSRLFKADPSHQVINEVRDANLNGDQEWLSYANDIFIDNTNNLWLGSRKGVMYTKNKKPLFSPFNVSQNQSFRINHAYSIYPLNDSIIYVASETGLLKINIFENEILPLGNRELYYFITMHESNLLVSNKNGLYVYKSEGNQFFNVSAFYPELKTLDHTSINSLVYVTDSLAIIGSEKSEGFFIWNYKTGTLRRGNDKSLTGSAEANIVNACYKARDATIWILSDDLITVYDPLRGKSQIIKFNDPVSKLPISFFFDVTEAGGYYWLASYSTGIIQLDKNLRIKKIYSDREGLSNTGVYKVFPLNDTLLFISTNNGLSVLDIRTGLFSNFYQEDGLNSNSFEEGCGIFKNGKIYVGGVNGFTILDPATFEYNKLAPKLYISEVRVETTSGVVDTSDIELNRLVVPSNVLQTTIAFSSLNFSNPARTSIAYKVKQLNDEWTSIGSDNFINLLGVGPGKYTLLVRSSNENGIWTEKPVAIELVYLPKWYQTLGFKIIVGLLIAAIVFSIYKYRINQLKKQEQIRQDIANDLHDDFGGTLTSLKAFTHLAQSSPENGTYLSYIQESITQATAGLRDMIWVLDDPHDTINEFCERIKKLTAAIVDVRKIKFECVVDEETGKRVLDKKEKRNLLMIVKESITNAIKYSECKSIFLEIKKQERGIVFSLKDDGKGFDLINVTRGNGLGNISSRAEQIGYSCEIYSSPGKGTEIRVEKMKRAWFKREK